MDTKETANVSALGGWISSSTVVEILKVWRKLCLKILKCGISGYNAGYWCRWPISIWKCKKMGRNRIKSRDIGKVVVVLWFATKEKVSGGPGLWHIFAHICLCAYWAIRREWCSTIGSDWKGWLSERRVHWDERGSFTGGESDVLKTALERLVSGGRLGGRKFENEWHEWELRDEKWDGTLHY